MVGAQRSHPPLPPDATGRGRRGITDQRSAAGAATKQPLEPRTLLRGPGPLQRLVMHVPRRRVFSRAVLREGRRGWSAVRVSERVLKLGVPVLYLEANRGLRPFVSVPRHAYV